LYVALHGLNLNFSVLFVGHFIIFHPSVPRQRGFKAISPVVSNIHPLTLMVCTYLDLEFSRLTVFINYK
jgi:hypothetical protein